MTTPSPTGTTTPRDSIAASWSHRFDRSALRGPGGRLAHEHLGFVRGLIETLTIALDADPALLRPGSLPVRELEKATAFAGAALAATSASGFEVAALILSLRDAVLEHVEIELRDPITNLFEWLLIVALDAFATAGTRAALERSAEELEAGTPVVLIAPEIPAVFLVGAPPTDVLDSLFARAMLLLVRVAAASVLIDATGLADCRAPGVMRAVERWLCHPRLAAVEVVTIGVPPDALDAWHRAAHRADRRLRSFERFDAALSHAYGLARLAVVRRG